MKRIGLIGGMSWESTNAYYSLFNQLTAERYESWVQPPLLIDSVNFSEIVALQEVGDWSGTGRILADCARRLEAGGATVLGIGANTMHMNFQDVVDAVSIPVVDVRDAIVTGLKDLGATSLSLLGTRYVMENDFYSSHLEARGVTVVKPSANEIDELQAIIFDELTQGVVNEKSRQRLFAIAEGCRTRGGDIVGLCCTEFGMLVNGRNAPWPYIDSTVTHVRALLDY
ncbi:MAG: amino acid racemase [Acidimicrobiales bacterium]